MKQRSESATLLWVVTGGVIFMAVMIACIAFLARDIKTELVIIHAWVKESVNIQCKWRMEDEEGK